MERKKKLCHGQCIEIAITFSLFSAFSLAMDSFAYLLIFLVQFTNDPLAVPFYGGNDSVMCAPAAVT